MPPRRARVRNLLLGVLPITLGVLLTSGTPSPSAEASVRAVGRIDAAPKAAASRAARASRRRARAPAVRAPALTFGIYPGGAAGTVGPSGIVKPEDPVLRLARLQELRGDRAFVVHLYDSFTGRSDGDGVPAWLQRDIESYTANGFEVELVLTYRPASPLGDVPGFVDFVRSRVAQLGPNQGVTALQVTNEVNIRVAPNAADGWYRGAVDALLQGIVAGKAAARAGGHRHLRLGFNWAYERTPYERALWSDLGRRGGAAFASAVDWVGLDVYPGTWGPPLPSGSPLAAGTRSTVLAALSALRGQHMPAAGLAAKPIRVVENGFPTGIGRSDADQTTVMRAAIQAVSDARTTYGVTDYRWFDLRDADSDGGFEMQYGITRDDYSPKPAFGVLRELVASLGRAQGTARAASRTP